MGAPNQQGFTIIEVTLFLALTALLAVMLLGGWTTMVNTQRYKDSNKTLQTFLQDQYNLVYNVENGRGDNFTCSSTEVEEVADSGDPRGQTDCVVMGRYITIADGTDLTVQAIIGHEPSGSAADDLEGQTDFEQILGYQPERLTAGTGLTNNELTIPWGAEALGSDGAPYPAVRAVVIIRAPITGTVYTLTRSGASAPELDAEFIREESQSNVIMCLDAGAPLVSERTGVIILEGASSQSSVQPITSDEDAEIAC